VKGSLFPKCDYIVARDNVMSRKKGNKKTKIKVRNWFAVHAFQRSGSGNHGDKRKEQSKRCCRGRHNEGAD
jgi:hypothetical protein